MISEPKEHFIKQKLHRSCQEGGITEYIEDVFGCRNEECFSLFDADAIDVRFAPEAYDNHERVGMEINLCSYLYDDTVDGEVGTVNEFGVGFGGIVRGTILGPNLIVDSFLGLLDMEFAWFAGSIDATEVIDTVGDIRGLLNLDEEVTGSDGMESSGRQEIEVSLVRLVGGDDILHG